MKLFLIRHGLAEMKNGEMRLSKRGISQSKKLSIKLRKIRINRTYTSNSTRSKETVKEYTNKFIEDERLKEVYRVIIGGPKKEGTSQHRATKDKKRADEFFDEVLKKDGNMAIFCHGNIIKYFLNKILKSKENLWEKMTIDNCSVSIIEKKENKLIIKSINLKDNFEEIKDTSNVYFEN
jgi:serine/threonine-protein phosphatase PGAM5